VFRASASAANTSAGASSGSAAQALAIYGSTTAQQAAVTAAQSAQSAAQGYAASAASVVTQDLSGVTAAALHRSPNAVTAMFVYDTSKDSDGGAWTEKCQNTSWYNEALSGNWLGSASSELVARCANATLGTDVTNGGFDTDTVWTKGSGWVISNGVASMPSGTSPSITQNAPQTLALGDIVKVTFTLLTITSGRAYIVVAGTDTNSGSEQFSTPGTYTRYVPISTLTNQTVGIIVGNSPTGISIDNVSFRKITSLNTASNDYFQLTTDGKFYKLWKNLFKYSNSFTTAGSGWSGMTVAATTATTAPDGSNTAFLYTEVGTNGHSYTQNVALTAGVTYTVSAYMKNSTRRYGALTSSNYNNYTATFDLQTPSTVAGAGATSTITSVGNGWYLCTMTFVANTTVGSSIGIGSNNSSSGSVQSYVLDGNTDLYFWRTQIEVGSTATSYEAKTVDGSTTEVVRGNKAKFPKLVGIVAEAASVTLYDLTEAGRPMWMRFVSKSTGWNTAIFSSTVVPVISSITAMNNILVVGADANSGLTAINFYKDNAANWTQYATYGGISNTPLVLRNTLSSFFRGLGSSLTIVNSTVYAVAMTVLPDAPLDPVTGLQVPTIAVGTGLGVSVIKHDGTVSSTITAGSVPIKSVWYADNYLFAHAVFTGGGSEICGVPANATLSGSSSWLSASWVSISKSVLFSRDSDGTRIPALWQGAKNADSGINNRIRFGNGVAGIKTNYANIAKTVVSNITNTYNTGHLLGDIRRAYLADSVVESISGTQLITNGTFDTDTSGWSTSTTGTSTAVATGGEIQITATVAYGRQKQILNLVAGKRYKLTGTARLISGAGTALAVFGISADGYGDPNNFQTSSATAQPFTLFLTPTQATVYVSIGSQNPSSGSVTAFDNLFVSEAVADRSYKASTATLYGTLTKALTNTANQVVAYSGFSSANYLQEPYSADLDFGTGEWSMSAWVNYLWSGNLFFRSTNITPYVYTPSQATVSIANYLGKNNVIKLDIPVVVFNDSIINGGSNNSSYFSIKAGVPYSFSIKYALSRDLVAGEYLKIGTMGNTGSPFVPSVVSVSSANGGVWQTITMSGVGVSGQNWCSLGVVTGQSSSFTTPITVYIAEPQCNEGTTLSPYVETTGTALAIPSAVLERSYSSGASLRIGTDSSSRLVATAFDGTTTRTVTTTTAYNTATLLKAMAVYKTDGSLAITINGVQVAITYGNPLLTLNNSSAVLTIGNSYALDAPFPGSIAQLKLSATAPTQEQALFMYEQEKQLFRDNAQSLLPESGAVVDLAYDDVTDKWIAASAANESSWVGLVRTGVTAVPAGSNIKLQATSGVKLNARSTTSPGVDVTLPAYNLKEEIVKRGEAAAKLSRITSSFDYVGGFTATTVVGNTAITAVAGLVYPSTVNLRGCVVTGAGIPASTTIVDIVGTTIYLSAKATAAGTLVQISLTDFPLPLGYEAKTVLIGGTGKIEGSTKDYVRLYDGFKETIRFSTAPGYTASIQLQAIRSAT
jgi:Concanavalin A-like lectin/glucanases superfamily